MDEKGLGCVATKDIKEGELVLRERPLLLRPTVDDGEAWTMESFGQLMKCFLEMPDEDKEAYMQLHNKYAEDHTKWSQGMIESLPAVIELDWIGCCVI